MPPATSIRLPYVEYSSSMNRIEWNTLGQNGSYIDIKGVSYAPGGVDFLIGYFHSRWATSESRIGFQSRASGGE